MTIKTLLCSVEALTFVTAAKVFCLSGRREAQGVG